MDFIEDCRETIDFAVRSHFVPAAESKTDIGDFCWYVGGMADDHEPSPESGAPQSTEPSGNPYESPASVAVDAGLPETRVRWGWLFGATFIACGLSLIFTALVVPFCFLLAPAFARAWRLRQLQESGKLTTGTSLGFGLLVIASFMYAIPSAFASAIGFCCVCLPGAFVGRHVALGQGNENYLLLILGGIVLFVISTFCGLWAGDYLLQRKRFYVRTDPHELAATTSPHHFSTDVEQSVNEPKEDR